MVRSAVVPLTAVSRRVPRGAQDASIQEGRHPVRRTASIRPTGATLVIGAMVGAVAVAGCGAGQITQTSEQVAAVSGAHANAGPIAVRDIVIQFAEKAGGEPSANVYPEGGDAPLQMTIVNTAATADRLVSASSPAAGSVQISGATDIAGDQAVVVAGVPEEAPAPTVAATPTTLPPGVVAPGAPATPSGAPTAAPTPTVAPTGPPNPAADNPVTNPTPGVGGFDPAGPGQGTEEDPAAIDKGTQIVLVGLTEDIRSGLTYPLTLTFERAGSVTVNVPVGLSDAVREVEHGE
jgi:copper(I)-binding protein